MRHQPCCLEGTNTSHSPNTTQQPQTMQYHRQLTNSHSRGNNTQHQPTDRRRRLPCELPKQQHSERNRRSAKVTSDLKLLLATLGPSHPQTANLKPHMLTRAVVRSNAKARCAPDKGAQCDPQLQKCARRTYQPASPTTQSRKYMM